MIIKYSQISKYEQQFENITGISVQKFQELRRGPCDGVLFAGHWF
jgi:hypothetical protein